MRDLQLDIPTTGEVEVDEATLAAIDRGIKAANEGRSVPLEAVYEMIPKWISKFKSQTPR
jgi:predicted transcriptional regulator